MRHNTGKIRVLPSDGLDPRREAGFDPPTGNTIAQIPIF